LLRMLGKPSSKCLSLWLVNCVVGYDEEGIVGFVCKEPDKVSRCGGHGFSYDDVTRVKVDFERRMYECMGWDEWRGVNRRICQGCDSVV